MNLDVFMCIFHEKLCILSVLVGSSCPRPSGPDGMFSRWTVSALT